MSAIQLPRPKPADALTVLVHHHQSALYLDELKRRQPEPRYVVLDNYADLPATLEREQPDAVVSFRMGFLGAFPREMLLGFPSIRWLHATGAGIEHLPPWDPARVMVTNSSGLHVSIMAEYAIWAMLDQAQRMGLYRQQQQDRIWKLLPVTPLAGRTVAIVGMGRIGREIGRRLAVFGARVVGVTRTGAPLAEADLVLPEARLDEALAEADICVILTPLTPRTRGLFGAERLLRLKPGCHLINLARGNIVDEAALRPLLAEGRIGHATFDVFHTEPLAAEDAMWDAPGVTVTPHVSGELAEWQFHAVMLFAENLGRWIAGTPLQNLCDPTLGY
ncbi:MAG: D-2-hydroxyacid dehydrogenase [Roseococcus sp.]|nr:D-2-hydroxyacid dehydrogenase [Roseococcus sp.]